MDAAPLAYSKNRLDRELEHRIALALLNVRVMRFRFLHFRATGDAATPLHTGFRYVQIDSRNGRVRLTGHVSSVAELDALREIVPWVPGIIEVIDEITLARPSRRFMRIAS